MGYYKFYTAKRARNGELIEKRIFVREDSYYKAQVRVNEICSYDFIKSSDVPLVKIEDEDEFIVGALAESFGIYGNPRRARFPEKIAVDILQEMKFGDTPSGQYRKEILKYYRKYLSGVNRAELVVEFDQWAEDVLDEGRHKQIIEEIATAVK